MSETVQAYDVFFVHNSISAFYESIRLFFLKEFYPRFKYGVITTYDKTIQTLIQYHENNQQQTFSIPTPSFSIDPSGDLANDDRTNFTWRYRTLTGTFGGMLYEPIYQDDYTIITPVFNRYIGSFNVRMFLSSVYEMLDLKVLTTQFFGSKERVFRPTFTRTYLHIPKEILTFKYTNNLLDIESDLDWSNTLLQYNVYKSLGKDEFMIPMTLTPFIKLTSVSSDMNKFGSETEYPTYNLSLDFTFEIEFPVFIVIKTDYKIDKVKCNLYLSGSFEPESIVDWIEHQCIFDQQCQQGSYHKIYQAIFKPSDTVNEIVLERNIENDENIVIYKNNSKLIENINYRIVNDTHIQLMESGIIDDRYIIQYWRKDGQ